MPQRIALLIANGEYNDPKFTPLVTPVNDVENLAKVLADPHIGNFETKLLINQTTSVIRREIEVFYRGKLRDDTLLLYYSGHGYRDDYNDLFFLTKDTESGLFSSTGIDANFVRNQIDKSNSQRKLIILDCCYSGAFTPGSKSVNTKVDTREPFEGNGYGRIVLSASSSTEYAWEGSKLVGDTKLSRFTQFLVDGLKTGTADTDGDGEISVDELYQYIFKCVITGEGIKQTPQIAEQKVEGRIVIAYNPNQRKSAIVKPKPFSELTTRDKRWLLDLENEIHRWIVDQEEPVSVVASHIRRAYTGIRDKRRPIGCFLFLGEHGTGKTTLAKTLARIIFGNENDIIQFNMAEFRERHNFTRLVGAPPGYIGYEAGGELTEAIKDNPHSVVHLNSFEEAHPEIWNMFDTIMEDGYLKDGKGQKIDFTNAIVIMEGHFTYGGTIRRKASSSVQDQHTPDEITNPSYEDARQRVLNSLEKIFRPGHLGRYDDVLYFQALSKQNISEILDRKVNELYKRLNWKNTTILTTEEAKALLVDHSFDPSQGACLIERVIKEHVEDNLIQAFLSGTFQEGNVIELDVDPAKQSLKVRLK